MLYQSLLPLSWNGDFEDNDFLKDIRGKSGSRCVNGSLVQPCQCLGLRPGRASVSARAFTCITHMKVSRTHEGPSPGSQPHMRRHCAL